MRKGEKPNKEVMRELVLKRIQRQKKVFGKTELEQIPVQKAWDHVIELKEGFVPKKGKVYILLREEQKEIQIFVKDQLYKKYI